MNERYLFDDINDGPAAQVVEAAPQSRRTDPATSYEAADRLARSGRLHSQRRAVFEALRRHDGATHAELGAFMGIDWLVCVRRLPELERAGLVRKGEPRECRVKGSRCTTWWVEGRPEADDRRAGVLAAMRDFFDSQKPAKYTPARDNRRQQEARRPGAGRAGDDKL